jgi:hypothetical protein
VKFSRIMWMEFNPIARLTLPVTWRPQIFPNYARGSRNPIVPTAGASVLRVLQVITTLNLSPSFAAAAL